MAMKVLLPSVTLMLHLIDFTGALEHPILHLKRKRFKISDENVSSLVKVKH